MTGRATNPAARLRRLLLRAARRNLRVLVLGIGNEMLGDDAVGHLLAGDLAATARDGFLAVGVGVAVENAGPLVRGHRADAVILVDAAMGAGRAAWGFVPPSRLDTFCHSTHSVPLSLLTSAWQADNPELEIHFIGIRPVSNELGAPISPAVAAARAEIAGIFRECLLESAEEQRG